LDINHRQPPHAHHDMVVNELAFTVGTSRFHRGQHARQDMACPLWLHAITHADNPAHA
jgi:hypothetical protein